MEKASEHVAVEWLRLYGDQLYAFALARVAGDAATAEDLVQETLLAALKSADNFRGDASRETWLTAILRNKILDHYRRAARNREYSAGAGGQEESISELVAQSHRGSWSRDAAGRLESQEFRQVFDQCLAEINTLNAQAFMLIVMDGLSTQEACSLLDITPTNLSVRLCRARLELREKLQQRWFEGE